MTSVNGSVSRRLAVVFLAASAWAAMPPSARADGHASQRGDDCAPGTRNSKCEWGPVFARSKHLTHLDCLGIADYAERLRFRYNQHSLTLYNRAMAAPAPAPASTTSESSLDPIASPPTAAAPEKPVTPPAATPAPVPAP